MNEVFKKCHINLISFVGIPWLYLQIQSLTFPFFLPQTYRQKMSACASTNTQQTKCNLLKLPCNSYEVFQKYLPRRKLLLDAVTANEVNLFSYVYIRDIFFNHFTQTLPKNKSIYFRQKLARDCSKNPNCICSRDSFGTVNVTCKNANLTHLPKSLPPKTTTLDVSNNKVTSYLIDILR